MFSTLSLSFAPVALFGVADSDFKFASSSSSSLPIPDPDSPPVSPCSATSDSSAEDAFHNDNCNAFFFNGEEDAVDGVQQRPPLFSSKNKPLKSLLKRRTCMNMNNDMNISMNMNLSFSISNNTTTNNNNNNSDNFSAKRVRFTEDTKDNEKPSSGIKKRKQVKADSASVVVAPTTSTTIATTSTTSTTSTPCFSSPLDENTLQVLRFVYQIMQDGETLELLLRRLDLESADSPVAKLIRETADNLLFQGEFWIYQMEKRPLSRLFQLTNSTSAPAPAPISASVSVSVSVSASS